MYVKIHHFLSSTKKRCTQWKIGFLFSAWWCRNSYNLIRISVSCKSFSVFTRILRMSSSVYKNRSGQNYCVNLAELGLVLCIDACRLLQLGPCSCAKDDARQTTTCHCPCSQQYQKVWPRSLAATTWRVTLAGCSWPSCVQADSHCSSVSEQPCTELSVEPCHPSQRYRLTAAPPVCSTEHTCGPMLQTDRIRPSSIFCCGSHSVEQSSCRIQRPDNQRCLLPTAFKDSSGHTTASAQ